ncbi:MAG: class I SAM-dependent methyltransferase [Pseudomonadota bacterium]
MDTIEDYYEQLAESYDEDRFGRSYGRYIDQMERAVLKSWLVKVSPSDVVDLGCGTGRLLDFALTGVDSSAAMLKVAGRKHPDRHLIQAGLPRLEFAAGQSFQAAICFHVFMHLQPEVIEQSLSALARVIRPGGMLIFDLPSRHRRNLNRRPPSKTGWHGDTAATRADVERWAGPQWRVVQRRGILFFPIHRLPDFARPWFKSLDDWIGRSPLRLYASYHLYQLERRA